MNLSDSEIMMVEQLTYLNGEVGKAAGLSGIDRMATGQTVGEYLSQFTPERLAELDAKGDEYVNGLTTGREWAAMIRHMQQNPNIANLTIADSMTRADGTKLAYTFVDKNDPDTAIVAFKGTDGYEEWVDDVDGLGVTDTVCQKQALEYVNGQPYSHIITTGHSKGGNKAMYSAVLSDKVDRCVSLDGQGFSKEFLDKYGAEVSVNGGKITNYSLSVDYVHALLFPVPGSAQKYCQGYGLTKDGKPSAPQFHNPKSFFEVDADGNIVTNSDGTPKVKSDLEEDPSIRMLHDFTVYLAYNASPEDKERLSRYLGPLLGDIMSNGVRDPKQIADYLMQDPEMAGIALAYLARYMKDNNVTSDDISRLFEMLGIGELEWYWKKLIDLAKDNLTDGDPDHLIQATLRAIREYMKSKGMDYDLNKVWESANRKSGSISNSGQSGNYVPDGGKGTLDFSVPTETVLCDVMRSFADSDTQDISTWNSYASEPWYTDIHADIMVTAINNYFTHLIDVTRECLRREDNVFQSATMYDLEAASNLSSASDKLSSVLETARQLAETITL